MEHRDVFLLETIIEYCDRMSKYLQGITMEDFWVNGTHQDICAFYCLQIGENAGGLSEVFIERHQDMEWRRIIGLRNIIAHEYGSIDPSILWTIVTVNIPELRSYCAKVIGAE